MSREIRPVFVEEMNLLGFDRFWRYDPDYRGIYMLAEKNCYWYGGTKIAYVRGGRIGVDPVLHPLWLPGARLDPIGEIPAPKRGHDPEQMEERVLSRVDEVLRTVPHDIAYLAFSGGKDSLCMTHLLGRHFPDLVVSFGDTGMEFPQTYEMARWMEAWCADHGLRFWTTHPRIGMDEAWVDLFGPPSRAIRWCCSVCKSAPQTLAVRRALGRSDPVSMAITGVRASESPARAKYDDLEFSKKVKGQWSFNPIIKWGSLDVWRYILRHDLPIHQGYRIGLNRVGCVVCPMASAARSEWLAQKLAPETMERFFGLLRVGLAEELRPGNTHENFIRHGDWKFRCEGRMLAHPCDGYECHEADGEFVITVRNPTTDWRQWVKTVAVPFEYSVTSTEDGYKVLIPGSAKRDHRIAYHRLKNVFRKAAHCVGCGVCEANCSHGALRFENRQPIIHGCRQCGQCHSASEGCLRFKAASTARYRRCV